MAKWPIRGMASLCDVTSSKRVYAKDLCAAGVPFLRSKEIIEKLNGQETHSNPLFISEEHFQEILRTVGAPLKGDVLLTSRGTLGVPYIVKATDRFHFADGNLTWFRRFKDINSQFLKYFFGSPFGKAELSKCVIGSAQSAYTISALKNIAVPLPPLATQDRIASILCGYDDLIENNTRRIKILEDMAQMLYREWFVNFRFPGYEKVRMVDSELGPIPEGWGVQPLSEAYRTGSGGTPSRKEPNYFGGTIRWVKTQELLDCFILETDEMITEEGLKNSSAKLYPEGTVLMAMYGATIGKLGVLAKEAACNQASCAMQPKRPGFGPEFLYLTLLIRRTDILALRMGAAQQNISQEVIKGFPILVPKTSVVVRFTEHLTPVFKLVGFLQAKNGNLRTTRDLLLPKLISGEIPVEAADETAELMEVEA